MAIYKRPGSRHYWYKFNFLGRRVQASSRTTNATAARQIEAAHRVRLAKGEAGISARAAAPTLDTFAQRFLIHCTSTLGAHKTERFYAQQVRYLLAGPLRALPRDRIGPEQIARYTAARRREVSVATTNRQLATLRRILRLAAEWEIIPTAPKVRLLPGERPREYVLPRSSEARYLRALPDAASRVATLLLETGLRVSEALALRWVDVAPASRGHRGFLRVRREISKSGKPRAVPLTARALAAIGARPPGGEFVLGDPPPRLNWLEHVHARVRTQLGLPAEFVLHSLRHTALTRLGEAGADAFTIRELAGHASVLTSQRYVHPVRESLELAIARAEQMATAVATVRPKALRAGAPAKPYLIDK